MKEFTILIIVAIILICSACVVLLINPMREKFLQKKEYDPQEENPWGELLNQESTEENTKKRK